MMAIKKADTLTHLELKSRELVEQSNSVMAKSHALRGLVVERVMTQAIKTDLKVGLTFAGIALNTRDEAKRQRNKAKARIAYDAVMRVCKTLNFSDEDKVEVQARQTELRAALQELGESI